eukprot:CAMPEP_0170595936 /NCGR_PEP_ID=MMETSP0224-20130122/14835_1 /TAXON_ID=285029 /ORGANISM="Togula jolla, Strain CCCM 725" /LENGTH=641 /DNA_ID=CAMNT_0010920165 /DNA_START=129 /DNA_END=2054 /DNA_ORIENTATION=-
MKTAVARNSFCGLSQNTTCGQPHFSTFDGVETPETELSQCIDQCTASSACNYAIHGLGKCKLLTHCNSTGHESYALWAKCDSEMALSMKCGKNFGYTCNGQPPKGWGDLGHEEDKRSCKRKCRRAANCGYVTLDKSGRCTSWEQCTLSADDDAIYVWKNCITTTAMDDHGNTVADATDIKVGVIFHGLLEVNDDVDYFKVDLLASWYRFEMEGDTSVSVSVFDSSGNDLFEDEYYYYYYWDGDSRGPIEIKEAGVYYIKVVSGGSSASPGAYTLLVKEVPDDHGDRMEVATKLEIDVEIPGLINRPWDRDYFSVDLRAGDYKISTDLPAHELLALETHGNVTVTVYDSDGKTIGSNNNFEPFAMIKAPTLVFEAPQSGIYYVEVRGLWYTEPVYTLLVEAFIPEPDDHSDRRRKATNIEASVAVPGSLQFPGDVDWFRVNLLAGSYKFLAHAPVNVSVYDSDGRQLSLEDDPLAEGSYHESRVFLYDLIAGVYFIKIAEYLEFTAASYDLHVEPIVDDHGDLAETATRVQVGVPMRGELDFPGDVDYFCTHLSSGTYIFETSVPAHDLLLSVEKESTHGDTTLRVFNGDGESIGFNDDAGNGRASRVQLEIEADGDYCMKVAGWADRTMTIYDVVVKAFVA